MANPESAMETEPENPKNVKDKNCPYCDQPFTSSSLGRHLDLYIKPKNPKPADGIHNIDEIRRLREGVTRRQSKPRRRTSTPVGTPYCLSKTDPASEAGTPSARSPLAANTGNRTSSIIKPEASGRAQRWEATGITSEAPAASPGGSSNDGGGVHGEAVAGGQDTISHGHLFAGHGRRSMSTRAVSRQALKAQLDIKQKLQDSADNARAAELALKEILMALRAAKQDADLESMPFEFDPLSMDFPALALQCLRPPRTLFALTQHATPMSWSTTPPGPSQYEALEAYFTAEFRKWIAACDAATTALHKDVKHMSQAANRAANRHEVIKRAENKAEGLKNEVFEHLSATFAAWSSLPEERKMEVWLLELARRAATKQTEIDNMKKTECDLRQEVKNLKTQVEQLNRLQQPREFHFLPPAHIPISEAVMRSFQDDIFMRGRQGFDINLDDRQTDLNSVVMDSISRWKKAILAARTASSGLAAQKPLSAPAGSAFAVAAVAAAATTPSGPVLTRPIQQNPTQQLQATQPQNPVMTPTAPTAHMERESERQIQAQQEQTQDETPTELDSASGEDAEGGLEEQMSDKDADAEIEDGDEFAHMHTPISRCITSPMGVSSTQQQVQPQQQRQQQLQPRELGKPQKQQLQQQILRRRPSQSQKLRQQQKMTPLRVSRSRDLTHQRPPTVANNTVGLSSGHTMPQTTRHHTVHQTDLSLTMPTLGSDQMYMD